MKTIQESIKQSIENQLAKLEAEEKNLNQSYESNMRTASDYYYVSSARSRAKQRALTAQQRLDEIVNRKLELLNELKAL